MFRKLLIKLLCYILIRGKKSQIISPEGDMCIKEDLLLDVMQEVIEKLRQQVLYIGVFAIYQKKPACKIVFCQRFVRGQPYKDRLKATVWKVFEEEFEKIEEGNE